MAIDAKGRLAVPTRHRELLQALCGGQLTLTLHVQNCVMIFPRPEWESFRERIGALPMSSIGWKRRYLGNAIDVDIDGAGRILVSPELRESAGLGKSVMLLGMKNHFELWDPEALKVEEAKLDIAAMPESIQEFVI